MKFKKIKKTCVFFLHVFDTKLTSDGSFVSNMALFRAFRSFLASKIKKKTRLTNVNAKWKNIFTLVHVKIENINPSVNPNV